VTAVVLAVRKRQALAPHLLLNAGRTSPDNLSVHDQAAGFSVMSQIATPAPVYVAARGSYGQLMSQGALLSIRLQDDLIALRLWMVCRKPRADEKSYFYLSTPSNFPGQTAFSPPVSLCQTDDLLSAIVAAGNGSCQPCKQTGKFNMKVTTLLVAQP
jgi:hypothetical protein